MKTTRSIPSGVDSLSKTKNIAIKLNLNWFQLWIRLAEYRKYYDFRSILEDFNQFASLRNVGLA